MDSLLSYDESGTGRISARVLHENLGVGKDFSNWIKDRIEKYGFIEGLDYQKSQSPNLAIGDSGHTGGKPTIEYFLNMSMAKELALVENNDKGREVRKYLVKVEEAWNTPEMVMLRAQQLSVKMLDRYKEYAAKLESDLSGTKSLLARRESGLETYQTMLERIGAIVSDKEDVENTYRR
jgi:anti-repressor protein